jgi:hypothetical protein
MLHDRALCKATMVLAAAPSTRNRPAARSIRERTVPGQPLKSARDQPGIAVVVSEDFLKPLRVFPQRLPKLFNIEWIYSNLNPRVSTGIL